MSEHFAVVPPMSRKIASGSPICSADAGRADDASGRPGLDEGDGPLPRRLSGRRAGARLHDVEAPAQAVLRERRAEVVEIAGDGGLHVAVEDRRARALVLAPLAGDLRGDRDVRAGQEVEEAIARGALVLGVGVGVQEADGDRLDALRAAGVGDGVELGELERDEDVAVAVDALAHLEAQPSRHERLGLAADEVVHVGPVSAADLEHVAEAARRDERRQGAGALGERVDDDRRAVDEVPDALEGDLAVGQAGEHALGQARRGRRRLGDAEVARLGVEEDEVGERAADVRRGDEAHRAGSPAPCPQRRPSRPRRRGLSASSIATP